MPPKAQVLLQKAVALHQAGKLADAAALYDQVLHAAPKNRDALNLRALVFEAYGDRENALALFDRAIAAHASFPEAHFNRANTLAALKRHDEALAAYRCAITARGDYADAHLNHALLLRKLGRHADAHAAFMRMTAACPQDARAFYGLGNEAATLGDFAAAIAHMRDALRLRPAWPQALNDLGSYLNAAGASDDAIAAFEQSATAGGDAYLSPRVNAGLVRLARGDLAQGWDSYALRNADPENPYRAPATNWAWPQWQGEDLRGKKIFLWNDQGIGDAILYASIVPEILAVARHCVIGCDPRLVPLFARSFPAAEVVAYVAGSAAPETGPCDFHSPLLDLGRWRRRAFSDFPNRRGYLVADPVHTARFRRDMRAHTQGNRLLAGISWRSTNPIYGATKSLRLADFEPLLRDRGIAFFDLQYGDTRDDVAQLTPDAQFHTTTTFDRFREIDSLAAYVAALDLVVTVSNTTAHLAAALGVPTWILVPPARARLWYWFDCGVQSPWYSTARLFRAHAAGWPDMLAEVGDAARMLASGAT